MPSVGCGVESTRSEVSGRRSGCSRGRAGTWRSTSSARRRGTPRQVSIDGRQIEDEGSDAAEREALFRKVEASVDSELTELQKLIVRKHEYEGQSFERIAKDLGMRQEAVRMHISRARKILRDKFRNETDE